MQMDYIEIQKNEKQFLAVTSLKVEEFKYLLYHFRPEWEKHYRSYKLDGSRRKILTRKEHGNSVLQGTPQKLFFLLVYLKNNSLQQYEAANFGISQPKVSVIARQLLSVLNTTLHKMKLSPLRDGELLQDYLASHSTKIFTYDGTEREILRNSDDEAQKLEYSGKHKRHGIKNNVLCDDNQFIQYLSPTVVSSQHDKSLADDFPILLPKGSVLRQDLGFLGHQPPGVTVEIGIKKPRNGVLTFSQKLYNKLLSGERIVIEHVNSGIKRLKMLKETIRNHSSEFRDMIMCVGCALHNLRVISPYRDY
jgi:DDE superfamily endonuclease/Helix-turn-helix of DDE superfamily endonuclease